MGIQDVISFVSATEKDPGVWQLCKRLGNLKMFSPASGQTSDNLPKSLGLSGDDLMKDGTQDVKSIFLHVKIPAWLQVMPIHRITHVTCSGTWNYGSTGMGMAWQVLPWSLLKEELQDEESLSLSLFYLSLILAQDELEMHQHHVAAHFRRPSSRGIRASAVATGPVSSETRYKVARLS